jgi:thiamine biosynthesis lipoprotein
VGVHSRHLLAGCVLRRRRHRLSDPRTVRSAPHWRRITVHHASAAIADALSTALCAASAAEIAAVPPRIPGALALDAFDNASGMSI